MESRRYLPFVRPRMGLAALAVAVLLALSWPGFEEDGLRPDVGLHVVEVAPGAPLGPAAVADDRFQVVGGTGDRFASGEAVLFLADDGTVFVDPSRDASRAAWHALDAAARAWLDERLLTEGDAAAAFPLQVNVTYEARTLLGTGAGTPGAFDADAVGGAANQIPPPDDGLAPGGTGTGPQGPRNGTAAGAGEDLRRPGAIDPPFPLRSLLLTFAYLVPANFVAQLYAGSMLNVRLRRRGLLVLSTPHEGRTVLAGLSLPYAILSALIIVGVSIGIGSGWMGMVAMLPVFLVLLSGSLLVGLLSRSQREMTFLLIAVTTAVATFLFLPAMFVQVAPVAFLSPVAVVGAALQDEPVGLGAFLYATAPLALAGVALTLFGVALFRAEHLFAPTPFSTRVRTALGDLLPRKRHVFLAAILTVPFALASELLVLVVAVMLALGPAFLLFLFGSAFVEEALKGLVAYAHLNRPGRRIRARWVGPLVGMGFVIGEKLALLVAFVGFGLLPGGTTALATFGVASAGTLVVAPALLHMATASIFAAGAAKGRKAAVFGLWGAVLVHAGYNAALLAWGVSR